MTPTTLLILVAVLVWAGPARARQDGKDAQYAAALQQGDRTLELRQFDDALEAYKRASNLRNTRSAEALLGIARAYRGQRSTSTSATR